MPKGKPMIEFFVPGVPVPKGSAKAFVVKGRAIVTQDNGAKQKPWASSISYTAMQSMRFEKPVQGPVSISLTFYMPRPKGHYGSGKNSALVKDSAPQHHVSKPDLDKLVRCVKDALTGVVWNDDSQVCQITDTEKLYETASRGVGVKIRVTKL
jgi:Holliday junction resolvase RusA-like endonuclease